MNTFVKKFCPDCGRLMCSWKCLCKMTQSDRGPSDKAPAPTPPIPLRAPRADIDQFVKRIKEAAHEMDGRASVAEIIGAIEIAKLEILRDL